MQVMAILDGPIVPTIIRLAWPTVVVLIMQTLVGVAETYFVSFLGTPALAGVTLVFPVLMLMTMVSNGGIGGGVSSSVGRAIGAGRKDDADALVLHALVLAVGFGLLFTLGEFAFGESLYRALGGSGAVLGNALTYGNIIFAGAIFGWITALLASALRGSGNVVVPAAISVGGFFILLPLSPALIFGLGPFPRLGVAGAGLAAVIYFALASVVLIVYLRSPFSRLRLPLDPRRLKLRLFADILRVGGLSAIGGVQSNLTVTITTAVVGAFGASAIAGYGLASRIDYMLIPLLFGLGTAIVTMVATNLGAGQRERAYRIGWYGGIIAFAFTEIIGVAAAIAPGAWLGLFTHDSSVVATGSEYLRIVGPLYGFFGLGLMLYFAGQGVGRVFWPVLAGTIRLAIVALLGVSALSRAGSHTGTLFAIIALTYALYGLVVAAAFWMQQPRRRRDVAVQPAA